VLREAFHPARPWPLDTWLRTDARGQGENIECWELVGGLQRLAHPPDPIDYLGNETSQIHFVELEGVLVPPTSMDAARVKRLPNSQND
jgi:hypothetical protein